MTAIWRATVLTIFPEMFPGPLGSSLAGKALAEGKWALRTIDIRDFATDKYRSVDDTPAGGGAGMVMRADVVASAIDAARAGVKPGTPTLYLSPRGKTLTQQCVRDLAQGPGAILLCGRFEGIDQRVLDFKAGKQVGLVVETGCRYFSELAFPDRVTAGLRVATLGTSSVRYEIGLFRDDDDLAAAEGFFVHVYVDRLTRRPMPLADTLRTALQGLLVRM